MKKLKISDRAYRRMAESEKDHDISAGPEFPAMPAFGHGEVVRVIGKRGKPRREAQVLAVNGSMVVVRYEDGAVENAHAANLRKAK